MTEPARNAPLDLSPEEFRIAGHHLVDRLAEFLGSIRDRPLTPGESPAQVRSLLDAIEFERDQGQTLDLLDEAASLLIDHSLLNGHPRFFGYITSSAAPIGALADLLAAAVNPNAGAWQLAPMATEIERQCIRWIADLVGYPPDCGGIMVSGGNMANFVGMLAARRAGADWAVREEGLPGHPRMTMYATRETHTWMQKGADLFGFGIDAIRWIEVDAGRRMDPRDLRARVQEDRARGDRPFLVVATAGSVGLGVVDPLDAIADVCRDEGLWFHVDGAYGAIGAILPDADPALEGMARADSLALDPHKWLYAPLEVGCALVRDPSHMVDAFSFHPEYYRFETGGDEPGTNYHEFGMQNSRGFRALKVWLGLRQAGRDGLRQMVADDVALAEILAREVQATPRLELHARNLSITTFRYLPTTVGADVDAVNEEILSRLQAGGEAFVSNAVVDGRFLLRACVVNFRSTAEDMREVARVVVRIGAEVEKDLCRAA